MEDDNGKSDIQPRKSCEIDQDPDYREAAPPDRKKLKLMEDTGKFCFGEKVKQIFTKCFDQELERQENEIKQIDEAIFSVQQKLHVLRNVILQNFFSGKRSANIIPSETPTEPVIHPTVKQAIGKRPPDTKTEANPNDSEDSNKESQLTDIKIPRYVPPTLPEVVAAVPVRGEHRCSRKKLYIGNVSKWIPVSERTDNSSHKWMVYVRGPKENPDISTFVKKIVFYLHPSYAPHDVVQVSSYPFHITRRGWGEFPLRVQLFFNDLLSKPVNVIHHLKLDRTYTGLQTLGSETVIDVFVNDAANEVKEDSQPVDLLHRLEQANEDLNVSLTEKEASFDENVFRNIKMEKEDHEERVEDINVCQQQREENAVINESSTVTIKTEKEGTLLEEEAPVLQVKAERDTTKPPIFNPVANATPPKIIQIKSLLNPAARLLAPGTVTFPNKIGPQSLIRPMIVRCVNKEGVPIRLPINLLRKAIVVRPSRLIRPGESLLRAPLLRPPVSSVLKVNPKPEVQLHKIELAKTDSLDFEETVLAYEWLTTRDCIRKIAQHIQIIDSRASEPSFRSRHPFSCPSLEIFSSWNIGKQRSCEWLRARIVFELLTKCKIKHNETWSVKTVFLWCRHHGYSPMTSNPIEPKPSGETAFHSTVTAHKSLNDPIVTDCIVDVESSGNTGISNAVSHRVNDVVTLNSEDPDMTNWIAAQLKKFGYRLSPELCDNALVNFTDIIFTRLWKSLADDLLRRSLKESWARQRGSNPDLITLGDAFNAITQRPEYDLFTNAGLSLPIDTSRSLS